MSLRRLVTVLGLTATLATPVLVAATPASADPTIPSPIQNACEKAPTLGRICSPS
jgi:hypothetical protein